MKAMETPTHSGAAGMPPAQPARFGQEPPAEPEPAFVPDRHVANQAANQAQAVSRSGEGMQSTQGAQGEPIWLKHYPSGVPAQIALEQLPATLNGVIGHALHEYARRVAFINFGTRMRFEEVDRHAQAFAGFLTARGVRKGDRLAIMLPNLMQYPICMLGAWRVGAVVVGCNPLHTARELELQLRDCGANTIVILEQYAHMLEDMLPRTTLKHVVVTSVGEMLSPLRGAFINLVLRQVRKLVPAYRLPQALSLRRALELGAGQQVPNVALSGDDLALLQYTGGTTGTSKGACLSHRNLVANIEQARLWLATGKAADGGLIVTALPLYHIFALMANCLLFLRLGATNLLITNPRDVADFVKTLARYRFTAITGVNTLFATLLNQPEFRQLDFSALRLALGGGMAVQAAVAKRWKQVTGVTLTQAYGLSETSPAVTINPLSLDTFNGSIGLPLPSTLVTIRRENGSEVKPGDIGEICVQGPQVMRGYWMQPAETARVFHSDGSLRTGDLGYINPDGFVYLVDRSKDMITVSGLKVYPNEVEEVVASLPGVREVAAIGVPDTHSGEVVKLLVVRKDPDLSSEMILAYCRERLARYKVPRTVEFRHDLPKTNVGKILRRALK